MSGHGFHPFGGRVSKHFGESLNPDDAYLSYYDVRLTREDVDTIKDDWLTDNAISFYEEWLEHGTLKRFPNARITLLRPSMCFMLIQTPDALSLKEALPDLTRTSHVFLPINDCRNPNMAEGGSHWSLLLVSCVDGVAFHYDSLYPSNHQNAAIATTKLSRLIGKPLRFVNLDKTPQQHGGSDCGVFVCMQMRLLLEEKLLLRSSSEKVNMGLEGVHIDAHKGRKDMVKLIESFRREGMSQSRSRSPSGHRGRHSHDSKSPPRIGD